MELKEGYKMTEVGVIPEDWEVKEFGMIVHYRKGFAFKSNDYKSDGIRVIRVSDTTYSSIRKENAIFIDESRINEFSDVTLEEYDLIFSTVGSKPPLYDSMVGKVILVEECFAGSLLNQNAVLIRAKNKTFFLQQLLLNHFKTRRYIQYIEEIFRGNANQASITLNDLFKFRVPLPIEVKEQTAIATALSDMDALITSLEQLIAKKRSIKQGVMQELLTGKRRLPGFDGEWISTEFGQVMEGFSSGQTPYRAIKDYYKGSIPWITSGELNYTVVRDTNEKITEGAVQKTNLKILPVGTFLMAITGLEAAGTRGSCAITGVEATTNQSCMALFPKVDKLTTSYLFHYYVFAGNELALKYCQGTKQQSYTASLAKKLPISLPSSIEEQQAISSVLDDLDTEITALTQKLTKLQLLKQGMMQNLLTGKIRFI